MRAKEKEEQEIKKTAPSVSELEADVAYFDARLSLLGRPTTCYQKAQEVVYRMLEGILIQNLIKKRGAALGKAGNKMSKQADE